MAKRLLRLLKYMLAVWALVMLSVSGLIFIYGEDETVEAPSDVIIVLGSGLRWDGRPGDALYRRSVWGAQLYRDGVADAVLCTGGVGEGHTRSEAEACAEVLRSRGVPDDAIYLEEQARSTEENAMYSKVIMEEKGWQRATLVTDSFHMFRADWLFNIYDIPHSRSAVPREWMHARFYARHFSREILALHWQAFKEVFNIPLTNVN